MDTQTQDTTATTPTNGVDQARAFRDSWIGHYQSEADHTCVRLCELIAGAMPDIGHDTIAETVAGIARLAADQTRVELAKQGLGKPW